MRVLKACWVVAGIALFAGCSDGSGSDSDTTTSTDTMVSDTTDDSLVSDSTEADTTPVAAPWEHTEPIVTGPSNTDWTAGIFLEVTEEAGITEAAPTQYR
ncbi:MAG: hypothetical protein ACI9MR_002374, partial [Myxococcota bacterium]